MFYDNEYIPLYLEGQCKAIYEGGSSTGILLFVILNFYVCTIPLRKG
jgi:hypothetical protein